MRCAVAVNAILQVRWHDVGEHRAVQEPPNEKEYRRRAGRAGRAAGQAAGGKEGKDSRQDKQDKQGGKINNINGGEKKISPPLWCCRHRRQEGRIIMRNGKVETCHIGMCYYISRNNMHGNYCHATGEYYLAVYDDDIRQIVIAGHWYDDDVFCHVDSSRGYSYDVVRELLRLGHLTGKTLASYIRDGGPGWWDQPK